MRRWLQHLVDRTRFHREARSMPRGVRRRIYRELLELREEERAMQEMLKLPVRPRISVVDEENIVLLRPRDRSGLGVDEALVEAREQREADEPEDDT